MCDEVVRADIVKRFKPLSGGPVSCAGGPVPQDNPSTSSRCDQIPEFTEIIAADGVSPSVMAPAGTTELVAVADIATQARQLQCWVTILHTELQGMELQQLIVQPKYVCAPSANVYGWNDGAHVFFNVARIGTQERLFQTYVHEISHCGALLHDLLFADNTMAVCFLILKKKLPHLFGV